MKINNISYPLLLNLAIAVIGACCVLLLAFAYYKYSFSNEDVSFYLLIAFVLFLFFVYFISSMYEQQRKFNLKFALKYILFLPSTIYFAFTRPECDFSCSYNDIEKLNIDINIEKYEYYSKNFNKYTAYRIGNITLVFTLLNNKKFRLVTRKTFPILFIRMVIDYARQIKNFSYNFSGELSYSEYKEKIDNYIKYGRKQLLSKNQSGICKIGSIFLVLLSILLYLASNSIIDNLDNDYIFPLCMFSIFPIFISFFLDIVLIIDNMWEERTILYNKKFIKSAKSNKHFNILLILFKVIVLVFIIISLSKYLE